MPKNWRQILKYKKLEESKVLKEEFGRQPYIKQLDLANVRTKFKFRTKMTQHVKMNFSSSTLYTDLWQCDSCRNMIDTQSHVLWCENYSGLREGKDLEKDEDLCAYLQEVFKIRHQLEILKWTWIGLVMAWTVTLKVAVPEIDLMDTSHGRRADDHCYKADP